MTGDIGGFGIMPRMVERKENAVGTYEKHIVLAIKRIHSDIQGNTTEILRKTYVLTGTRYREHMV